MAVRGGSPPPPPPPPGKIKHVVVIFQENRTPDNLFQDPVLISKGADIAQSGKDSKGNTIPLTKVSLTADYNPGHGHDAFIDQCDLNSVSGQCQMDGADLDPVPCPAGTQDCHVCLRSTRHRGCNPTFRWPSSTPLPTVCSRLTRGRAFRHTSSSFQGHRLRREEAFCLRRKIRNSEAVGRRGCDAPRSTCDASLIRPDQTEHSNTQIYPCFEHQTLTDLLDSAKSLTWQYYTPCAGSIWTRPGCDQSTCAEPNVGPPNATSCTGPDWTNHVVLDATEANPERHCHRTAGDRELGDSERQGVGSPWQRRNGPSWVASIVNAIGNSHYWTDTAIIITWDDWGGWYDHVRRRKCW